MGLLSESKTDERYMETVQEWLASPKQFRTRHTGAFLLLLAMTVTLPVLAGKGFTRFVAPEADHWLLALFSTARMAGLPLSYAGFLVLWGVRARRGLRIDRLMIKYHDELKEGPRGVPETGESVTHERDGLARGSLKSRAVTWVFHRDHSLRTRTDREYVTLARCYLKRLRRLSPVFFGAAVLHVALFVGFLWLMRSQASRLSGAKPWAGFAIGLASGLLGSLMAWCAVDHVLEVLLSFRNPRIAQLMLRYWDALPRGVQRGR